MRGNKLLGKTALITGSNGGIGQCIVKKLISEGANIICCARKETTEYNNFINSLCCSDYQTVRSIFFDLNDEIQIKNNLNNLIREKISLDILVNNAATANGSPIELTSQKKLKDTFEINFFSQIAITTQLLRLLKKSKSGRVINITSMAGIIGDRGTLSYGASKSAMIFATKVMANEFADYNITVNSVAPAVVSTGMSSSMNPKDRERMIAESFFKREIRGEDVANAVLFLSSEESSSITGQTIRLDGGMKI